jgi:cytoskeletal protein RodZ
LTAIEEDDYSLLPAEIFTRAYLRLYADELRLDGDYILDLFHDLGKDDNEDQNVLPEKEPEHVSSTRVTSAFHAVQASLHKVKFSIKTVPASLKKLISSCSLNTGLLTKCKPSVRMDFSFIQRTEPLKTVRKYLLLAVTVVAAPLAVIMISNSDRLFPEKPHAADKQFAAVKTTADVKKDVTSSENVTGTSETNHAQVKEKISEKLVPEKPHAADKQFAAVKTTADIKKDVTPLENVTGTSETNHAQVKEKISEKLFPEKPHAADKQFAAVKTTADVKKDVAPLENVTGTSETNHAQVKENISEKLVLKIIAEELTWASVRVDNGEYSESLLRKGESVTVMAENQFNLKIGNAGGTRLVLNDRELEELGPHGKVVNITLP